MDYLDQFTQDEDHVEIGEMVNEEEKAEDRNFIDDTVSFSSYSPSYYNQIDNIQNFEEIQNIDRNHIQSNEVSNQESVFDKQVENFTYNPLQNPEFNFVKAKK